MFKNNEVHIIPFYIPDSEKISDALDFSAKELVIKSEPIIKKEFKGNLYFNNEKIEGRVFYWKPKVEDIDFFEKAKELVENEGYNK